MARLPDIGVPESVRLAYVQQGMNRNEASHAGLDEQNFWADYQNRSAMDDAMTGLTPAPDPSVDMAMEDYFAEPIDAGFDFAGQDIPDGIGLTVGPTRADARAGFDFAGQDIPDGIGLTVGPTRADARAGFARMGPTTMEHGIAALDAPSLSLEVGAPVQELPGLEVPLEAGPSDNELFWQEMLMQDPHGFVNALEGPDRAEVLQSVPESIRASIYMKEMLRDKYRLGGRISFDPEEVVGRGRLRPLGQ